MFSKCCITAEHQWLTPVIPSTQELSGRSQFEASPGKQFMRPHLEINPHKKGQAEWLKV
jgi:hypothetical protein